MRGEDIVYLGRNRAIFQNNLSTRYFAAPPTYSYPAEISMTNAQAGKSKFATGHVGRAEEGWDVHL
jgi:hypothetical protein